MPLTGTARWNRLCEWRPPNSKLECEIPGNLIADHSKTTAVADYWNWVVAAGALDRRVTNGDPLDECAQPSWPGAWLPRPQPWESSQRWVSGGPAHSYAATPSFVAD